MWPGALAGTLAEGRTRRARSAAERSAAENATRKAALLIIALISSGCFKPWDVGGPWACSEGNTCPEGFSCDEGVCCVEGSDLAINACPTLPFRGKCTDGGLPTDYFQDLDGDGQGNQNVFIARCRQPKNPQWVLSAEDCDDTRAEVNRTTRELCDGLDNNCDGVIDDGLNNTLFHRDEDGDDFGSETVSVPACIAPPGYVNNALDCDDFNPGRNPDTRELCNNFDDNCDRQADQPNMSFADTDDVGSSAINFPCLVSGAYGVCQAGAFRCMPDGDGGVQRECRSINSASQEICDGLDNDCNNTTNSAAFIDERPGCGGPTSLLNVPNAVYRARRLPAPVSGGELNSRCHATRANTDVEVGTASGLWQAGTGNGRFYHVWSVEAAPNTFWDLSRLDNELRIAFQVTNFAPGGGADGIWGSPGAVLHPVIFLCGDTDDQYMRYRLDVSSLTLSGNQTAFDQVLPLNVRDPRWIIGIGSGFDTSKVRRIELQVFSNSTDFTIQFANETGFR